MTTRKKVLIISFTDFAMDPRVNRQVRMLKDRYQVIGAGAAPPAIDGVEFVRLVPRAISRREHRVNTWRLLTRSYERYYWNFPYVVDGLEKLSDVDADLVVANDIESLPLALRVAAGAPVVYDAHEFAPLELTDSLKFRLLFQGYKSYLCREYIPRATEMLTVCDGLAERYRRTTGVRPTVMVNAPLYEDLEPSATAPGDGRIRLIHHGGAMPTRQLELMIEMMRHLDDRFELHFMLVECGPGYMERLRRLAQRVGRTFFHPPVPMLEIARSTNRYDIGLYLLRPNNFNNKHSLPNKFFEFIQARLALAIGPSPEMARLVDRHQLGVIADRFDPRNLADKLNRLDHDDIARFRRNTHAVARLYSSDSTGSILRSAVERALTARRPTAGAGVDGLLLPEPSMGHAAR